MIFSSLRMFGKKYVAILFLPVLLLSFTSCVTTDEVGRLQWDVNELKAELREVKAGSRSAGGDKRLAELEETQKATSETVSDLLFKVQSLTSEFQVLTGRFEESRYQLDRTAEERSSEKDMLLSRLDQLEAAVADLKKTVGGTVPDAGGVPQGGLVPERQVERAQEQKTPATDVDEPADAEVREIYMEGYQAFKEGRSADARQRFETLINEHPDNEYSDNARFWLAESYYKDGSYEDAILAYEELFRKNPDSDKVPGAMLKQGLAFYELKDRKTGTIILEKLIEKFPDSDAAATAKKRISRTPPPKRR